MKLSYYFFRIYLNLSLFLSFSYVVIATKDMSVMQHLQNISRLSLIEGHLNSTHRLLPALTYPLYENKPTFSSDQVLQSQNKSVSKHVQSSVPSSFGKKAKEATKMTYYTAVVVAGVGAFGLMMYAIFRELLFSFSPQKVYSAAVDKVTSDPKLISLFGENIKCFGETSRRGRRQHINHLAYEVDGRKGIRIKFYLQGQYRSGSVFLDARMCSSGWEFRYLFVQSDSYPHEVVVLEDNRNVVDNVPLEGESSVPPFPLLSPPDLKKA